jgi:hypothetical protein
LAVITLTAELTKQNKKKQKWKCFKKAKETNTRQVNYREDCFPLKIHI